MKRSIYDLFKIPTVVQPLDLSGFGIKNHEIWIKRDDLIHEIVSGNKWRKLKYNIQGFLKSDKRGILSFGGNHSNHINALAFITDLLNTPSVAIIRGEEPEYISPTLLRCKELGTELFYVSRSLYSNKLKLDEWVKNKFSEYYVIPEGGANDFGIRGCTDIVKEIDLDFDDIYCDVGTGATCAGIALGLLEKQIVKGIVVLKGAEYLEKEVLNFVKINEKKQLFNRFKLYHNYHLGGYGRNNDLLINFMRKFYDHTGIKTDPIYSGKMFYGMIQELKNEQILKSKRIIALHSGGLQGLEGFEKRYNIKIYP